MGRTEARNASYPLCVAVSLWTAEPGTTNARPRPASATSIVQDKGRVATLVDPDYIRSVGTAPIEFYRRAVAEYGSRLGGYIHVSNDVAQGEKPEVVRASSDAELRRFGIGGRSGVPEGPSSAQGQSERDQEGNAGGDLPAALTISAYGAKNRFFTADRAEAARARIRDKLRNQLNAGLDPELAMDGMMVAGFHIEAGARKFVDLARKLAADFNTDLSALKPYLAAWYNGARDMLEGQGEDVSDMDGAGAVRAAVSMIEDSETVDKGSITSPEETTDADAPTETPRTDDRAGDEGPRAADAPRTEGERGPGQGIDEQGGDGGGELFGGEQPGGVRGDQRGTRPAAPGSRAGNDDGAEPRSRGSDSPGNRVRAKPTGRNGGRNYLAPKGSLRREGSWRATAERNLDIIELVNRLDAEGRAATPQEQALLAKFTGWGASEIANGLFRPDRKTQQPSVEGSGDEARLQMSYWGDWKDTINRARDLLKGRDLETAVRSTQTFNRIVDTSAIA